MFTSDTIESKENRVVFKDMDQEVLTQFIKFIYTGKFDDDANRNVALDLIFVAERYNMSALKKLCEFQVFEHINRDNVFEILFAVKNFDFIDPLLTEKCKESIAL
jgi:hypothetical protein